MALARNDEALAAQAQIPLVVLRAIRLIESGGSASAVRFEPHLFWRIHKNLPRAWTGEQIRNSLTAEELRKVPYTPCTSSWRAAQQLELCMRGGAVYDQAASMVGSETNRRAFERAAAVDFNAAVRATSWGTYQVLGSHLLAIEPRDPVGAFDRDPQQTSDRMLVSWFERNPRAAEAARRGDFAGLAAIYNGSTLWARRLEETILSGRAGPVDMSVPSRGRPLVAVGFVVASAALLSWSIWRVVR